MMILNYEILPDCGFDVGKIAVSICDSDFKEIVEAANILANSAYVHICLLRT